MIRIAILLSSCVPLLVALAACNQSQPTPAPQTAAPAPAQEAQKSIPGPVPGTRLDAGYVSQMGRSIYFWGWPMMNIHSRKVTFEKLPERGYIGGIVPAAPPN
ncbi:MAG TPA: hypothetical protein VF783_10350 [Terriglobales bacterium]